MTILSEAEKVALYGLPDFDDFQRAEYFALTNEERTLAQRRNGVPEQILCMLQIGYFQAKQAFFNVALADAPQEDIDFLLRCYFPGERFFPTPIRRAEYYVQCGEIARLYGYRLWSEPLAPLLATRAAQVALRDVTPAFILTELVAFLNHQKIVRPGYTTLRAIIVDALAAERRRLGGLVDGVLDDAGKRALQQLLVREDALSGLAAIKQDAKHFGYRMMVLERRKRDTLEPLYRLAQAILSKLGISQQNLNYYASLVHYYTIYDLRRLKPGQTYLYLLCYAWQRYRQLGDNLVDALGHHMKQLEENTKESAEKLFSQLQANKHRESPQVGRLLLLYVGDDFNDATPFGTVRQHAFGIMPKDTVLVTGQRLCERPVSQMELRWKSMDRLSARCKMHLRPLAIALEFSSTAADSPWLAALRWMKDICSRQQRLAQRPVGEIPDGAIPKRLRPHLLDTDADGNATSLRGDRYEFWVYRQIRKRLAAGEVYLNDSIRHRRFSDELVALDQKADVLKDLDIPWLRQPLDVVLDTLFADLDRLWRTFDRELQQGKLKHLEYAPICKTLSWRKPKVDKEAALQASFYAKLPACDSADIFRFVNGRCRFLSALTPLQPRYAKKIADEDSLMAVIFAQAMNHGNLSMAESL